MKTMKIRLILMGCIISALSGVLLATRGSSTPLVGLLAIGILVLVTGLVWR